MDGAVLTIVIFFNICKSNIMLYSLNLYSDVCKWFLNNTDGGLEKIM